MKSRKPASSISISELLKNPEGYTQIIAEGKTTAQLNLKKLPGRIFNDYPALVDEKKFESFVREATDLMDIPQRLVNIVTGADEPEEDELKDMEKTKVRVRDFYSKIIKESCHTLLNPKKREVDSNITKMLISDEKYLKVPPISSIVSLGENIIRSVIVEVNERFINDFCIQWGKEDVLRYQSILAACQTYRTTRAVDAFKNLTHFTLKDYDQREIYLLTHFGEKFIKAYDEQFEIHNSRIAKLNILVARFQNNWANDSSYFAMYCKKIIDHFYSTDRLNLFLMQLIDKNKEIKEKLQNNENKPDDLINKIRKHESTVIDSAVELITKFKVGDIDVLDLAKSIVVLTNDLNDRPKPHGLFSAAKSPPTTIQIINTLENSIKKRLSAQDLMTLNEFIAEIQKQKKGLG